MTRTITNEALSVKLEATNGILSRVEKKVDDLAITSINPQVFDLKIKELQVGISQNTVDILEIKKSMTQEAQIALEKVDDKASRQNKNTWSLVTTIVGTAVGALVAYLLTKR